MLRLSLILLLLLQGLFVSSCEYAAVEKVCVPLEGVCEDGDNKGRLMCNEYGTGWVQSDCPVGTVCYEGSCSTTGGGEIDVVTTGLPAGANYEPYEVQLEADGGLPPYGWHLREGELPEGLDISSDGIISGTTIEAGTWEFTLLVTDSGLPPAYTAVTFELTMDISPMSITADYSYEYMGQSINILPILIPYIDYSGQLGVTGGLPPHEWQTEEPPGMLQGFIPYWGLPEGLTMDSSGAITGSVTDTSDANSVQIPGSETTFTGYFLYMSVTDSQDPAVTKTGIFLIPTLPI